MNGYSRLPWWYGAKEDHLEDPIGDKVDTLIQEALKRERKKTEVES